MTKREIQPWTVAEVDHLIRMAKEGCRPAFIAVAMGRKYISIISKAAQLRNTGTAIPYWKSVHHSEIEDINKRARGE